MSFDYLNYLIFAIAVTLIFVGLKGVVIYIRAKSWVPTSAIIDPLSENYTEKAEFYTKIKYYFPIVRYQYEFGGKQYFADRVSLHIQDIWVPEVDNWGNKTSEEKKIWRKWRVNESIPVFVDPRKPHRSVIERKMPKKRRSHYLAMLAGGLICLIILAVINMK